MQNTQAKSTGTEQLVKIILILVGSVSALPVLGLFLPARLESIYGLAAIDEHVRLLLQHRALFFGMIGAGIIASAFKSAWRTPVLSVALLSKISFVLLVASTDATSEINRVALIDGLAIILLSVILFLDMRSRR